MGTFEVTRARKQLGFTPATSVPANIDVSGTGGTGAAVGQALVAGLELKHKYDLKVANTETSEYKRAVGFDDVKRDAEIANELDSTKHPEIDKRHEEYRNSIMPKSRLGKQAAELWNNIQAPRYAKSLSDGMVARVDDNWDTEAAGQIAGIKQDGDPAKLTEFEKFLARRQIYDPMDKSKAAGLLSLAQGAYKKGTIERLKPIIEQSLAENEYNMKPAIEVIDITVGQLQKAGILNDVEAAEARQDLSNWAADTAAQRKKARNENIIQTTWGFAEALADGTFTGDNVALSNLSKAEQKQWEPIVAGARKPAPTSSKIRGSNTVIETLTDYATGKIGELKALDNIIKARYEEDSITDGYYKFALSRIKNKYPDHVAKTISGATEAAKKTMHQKGIGFLGKDWIDSREKDKLVSVNTGLLGWIEEESKDGKYPSGEAIYKKVREMGISVKTPKNIKIEAPLVIPKRTESTYITNDEDYDKLESGTTFYDAVTGIWRIKP